MYSEEIATDCKAFFDIDDIEEELTSAEYLRIVKMIPFYKGAVRGRIEVYINEHEAEMSEDKKEVKGPALSLTPEQLRSNPKLAAAPAAGQPAPVFDVRSF